MTTKHVWQRVLLTASIAATAACSAQVATDRGESENGKRYAAESDTTVGDAYEEVTALVSYSLANGDKGSDELSLNSVNERIADLMDQVDPQATVGQTVTVSVDSALVGRRTNILLGEAAQDEPNCTYNAEPAGFCIREQVFIQGSEPGNPFQSSIPDVLLSALTITSPNLSTFDQSAATLMEDIADAGSLHELLGTNELSDPFWQYGIEFRRAPIWVDAAQADADLRVTTLVDDGATPGATGAIMSNDTVNGTWCWIKETASISYVWVAGGGCLATWIVGTVTRTKPIRKIGCPAIAYGTAATATNDLAQVAMLESPGERVNGMLYHVGNNAEERYGECGQGIIDAMKAIPEWVGDTFKGE